MKKIFIVFALAAFTNVNLSYAQDTEVEVDVETRTQGTSETLTSKSGVRILPEAGDYALGVSATPFLNYIGQLFTGGNTAPSFSYPGQPSTFPFGSATPVGNAIWVKKMIDENSAYRARVQFNFGRFKNEYTANASTTTPDPLNPQFVTDEVVTRNSSVLLALGKEFRKGNTRLQGIYGAEVMIGYYNYSIDFNYGNEVTTDFTSPETGINFGADYPQVTPTSNGGRIVEFRPGSLFFGGVRAFGGVEYFFLPKVSIAGELGYTLGLSTRGTGESTYEYFNTTEQTVSEFTVESAGGGPEGFGIGLDNVNANLNLLFYF